jgi:hypothetical protein
VYFPSSELKEPQKGLPFSSLSALLARGDFSLFALNFSPHYPVNFHLVRLLVMRQIEMLFTFVDFKDL